MEGCFAQDEKGVYLLTTMGAVNGISYFDFETQEYMPVVQSDYGTIVNLQMMYR